jgi:hypothetical protein
MTSIENAENADNADSTDEAALTAQTPALTPQDIPVGTPLPWAIADESGTLLLDAGASVPNEAAREFLFAHFGPRRVEAQSVAQKDASESGAAPTGQLPLTLDDLSLAIGERLGMRSRVGMGSAMHPGRVIGVAPNHALFVTWPLVGGKLMPLAAGEQLEVVVLSNQSVIWLLCTVEATCRLPFDYLVLSAPGQIRQLRARRAARMASHLAVRYGVDLTGNVFDGLGLGDDLSVYGLSLVASHRLGDVGERMSVAFHVQTAGVGMQIQAVAIIRNVQPARGDGGASGGFVHGLEFDPLEATQQLALKAYVLDLQDAEARRAARVA